jgi:hypothetical protein
MTSTFKADELGDETGDPIGPAVCESPLNAQVLAVDVAVLAEALPQGVVRLEPVRPRKEPDSSDLFRLLRSGGKRRNDDADSENSREPDQPHGQLAWGCWRGV